MARDLETYAVCSVTECDGRAITRGLCNKHYQRWLKYGDPLAGATFRGSGLKWLRENLDCSDEGCLIWPFGRSSKGYGHVLFEGVVTNASRVMCIFAHGNPPTEKHQAAHSCGNGHLGCVNPRHLRWATQSENQIDAIFHGTGRATITPDQAQRIRDLSRLGVGPTEIARRVGTTATVARFIIKRRTWTYLDSEGGRSPASV